MGSSEGCMAPCLGVARPKSSNLYDRLWDTWQHESAYRGQQNILVSPEEAFMIRKQQTLNIHFIPCERLK